MNEKIKDIAERISGMREIMDVPVDEMAQMLGMSEEEYLSYERGKNDFTFSFLYKVANRLGIDLTDLLTGRSPKLAEFTIVRKGEGLPIERRKGFKYESLAYRFKGRIAEPFIVTVRKENDDGDDLIMNTHSGQEFNYIISGSLKIRIEDHETILNEGDSIYYNSRLPHGMRAAEDECVFMAIIMNEKRSGDDA